MTSAVKSGYRGKRILVTGGGGYLAYSLVRKLADIPCDILRLFRKGHPCPVRFPKGAAGIKDMACDIANPRFWNEALKKTDFVFHLAAQTSVYKAEKDPLADMRSNVMPMVHMLEACKKKGYRPAIIFAGTSTETGIPEILPVNEKRPDQPVTVYDIHKLTAEKYLLAYAANGIVKGTSLRLTNVYGPGPKSASPERGFLNSTVRRALEGGILTMYGKGIPIRDYIFIDDAINAFFAAGQKIDRLSGRYYVIGSGKGHRISDMINLVVKRVEHKISIRPKVLSVYTPRGISPIEKRNFTADSAAFKKAAGWTPAVSLRDGIDATIDYYEGRMIAA